MAPIAEEILRATKERRRTYGDSLEGDTALTERAVVKREGAPSNRRNAKEGRQTFEDIRTYVLCYEPLQRKPNFRQFCIDIGFICKFCTLVIAVSTFLSWYT